MNYSLFLGFSDIEERRIRRPVGRVHLIVSHQLEHVHQRWRFLTAFTSWSFWRYLSIGKFSHS